MAGRLLDPAPFIHLYNDATDLVRGIEFCDQLGSLGQIFAEPSFLYVTLTATPDSHPAKHPKIGQGIRESAEEKAGAKG
eukprot:514995-Ditylum_brightwellii.AAC.2